MADEVKGFSPEEKAELKTALDGVYSQLESKVGTKITDETKKAIDEAMKPVNSEMEGLKKFKIEAEEASKKNQKWIDEQIAKGNTIKLDTTDPDSFKSQLSKAFEENKEKLANYTKGGRQAISFEMKTVGNIGANSNITTSGTPGFVYGSALSEPGRKGYEARHIRDLMRVQALPAGFDHFVIRDQGGEGGPTEVTIGSVKPQSDRDWVKTVVPVTKIAHYYKIPEEYLREIAWMQDEVTGVGIEELLALEDSKLLTASSSSTQFAGLNQSFNSTAFNITSSSLYNAVATANNWDALVAAWTQLKVTNPSSIANGALLHPYDYALMILAKSSTAGNYQFGTNLNNVLTATIIPHTAVTSDKFFLGDFSKVKLGVRDGLSVRFYDQNENDAIYNLVTVVIEERITMAADRADRIIYGDFSVSRGELQASLASV